MVKVSFNTLATRARQLVVHDALEMMWCAAGSYLESLTPRTMVMSSSLAGAEMMTFLTGPRRCFLAWSASVNLPVDSITTWAPMDCQLMAAGSFSENTRNGRPSMLMVSPEDLMSCLRFPKMESYFSRWARVAGLVRSLTATNSRLRSSMAVRSTLRPIRPKPLIPTLIAIYKFPPKAENLDLDAEKRCNGKTAQHLQNGLQIRVAEALGRRKWQQS